MKKLFFVSALISVTVFSASTFAAETVTPASAAVEAAKETLQLNINIVWPLFRRVRQKCSFSGENDKNVTLFLAHFAIHGVYLSIAG